MRQIARIAKGFGYLEAMQKAEQVAAEAAKANASKPISNRIACKSSVARPNS